MKHYDFYDSPHGRMLLVANDDGLCGVYFDGQKYLPPVDAEWRRDGPAKCARSCTSSAGTSGNIGGWGMRP